MSSSIYPFAKATSFLNTCIFKQSIKNNKTGEKAVPIVTGDALGLRSGLLRCIITQQTDKNSFCIFDELTQLIWIFNQQK
ncbi:hypothetical protein JM84_2074 [Dokdonia sp. Hel_I_63]|nr:hypothetical protein JM84_2074 [Dokdonia sp. Hel_I_63]